MHRRAQHRPQEACHASPAAYCWPPRGKRLLAASAGQAGVLSHLGTCPASSQPADANKRNSRTIGDEERLTPSSAAQRRQPGGGSGSGAAAGWKSRRLAAASNAYGQLLPGTSAILVAAAGKGSGTRALWSGSGGAAVSAARALLQPPTSSKHSADSPPARHSWCRPKLGAQQNARLDLVRSFEGEQRLWA